VHIGVVVRVRGEIGMQLAGHTADELERRAPSGSASVSRAPPLSHTPATRLPVPGDDHNRRGGWAIASFCRVEPRRTAVRPEAAPNGDTTIHTLRNAAAGDTKCDARADEPTTQRPWSRRSPRLVIWKSCETVRCRRPPLACSSLPGR